MKSVFKTNVALLLIITLLSTLVFIPAPASAADMPFLSMSANAIWGGSTVIRLDWTGGTRSGYYYRAERSINRGTFESVSGYLDAVIHDSCGDPLLEANFNNLYSYRIAVYDSSYQLVGYSNEASLTLSNITEPTNFKVTPASSSEIDLAWSYPVSKSAGTVIERKADGENWGVIAILPQGTLQYRDSSLKPNTQYKYRIRAMLGINAYSRYIDTYSTDTLLKEPGELTAGMIAHNMILLNWDYNGNQDVVFLIERKDNGGEFKQIQETGKNQILWVDNTVSLNNRYTYRIRARAANSSVTSSYSNEVTVVTMDLSAPGNLTATAISETEISLNWGDTSNNETGFELWRKIGENGTWAKYAVLDRNVSTFKDTGLSANTTYYYRVRANISYSNVYSAFSGDASAKTVSPMSDISLDYTVNTPYSIQLKWNYIYDIETNLVLYLEKKSESDLEWQRIVSLSRTTSQFTDNGLVPYTKYYYRMVLVNPVNNSSKAGNMITVSTGIPAAPTLLDIETLAPNTVRLKWTDNSHNEDRFVIERMAQGQSYVQIGSTAPGVTTFVDNSLAPGYTYFYKVTAVNKTGSSAYTNEKYAIGKALKSFNDIWNYDWAIGAIENLSSRGVITGKTENLFFPDDQITRAEFTSLVIRSFKLSRTPIGYLSDVSSNDWYYKDIMTANTLGIISADNGYFYPNVPITREDIAVIIYKALKAVDKPLKGQDIHILDGYLDKDLITPYALPCFAALKGEGILSGRSNTMLAPKDTATRAEAAVILYRIIDR